MSIFFPKQKRSYYQVISGDEEEDDPLFQHRSIAQVSTIEQALPPSIHETAEVSFDGISGLNNDMTKSDSRWNHIVDVDQFFSLVYEYHQGNGFLCIALRHCFALFQFVLIVASSTFLLQCVDYDVLFNNTNVTTSGNLITGKRHISDVIVPQCASKLNPVIVITILLAVVFWTVQLLRVGYRLLQLYEIQAFYHTVLNIDEAELRRVTWKEVVQKICKRQPDLHLVVNQEQITSLDIYQRILRYKNYMVAFVDNDVLSIDIDVPFVGKVSYLSSGLRLNLEWLLFWGPWKGFALKDEYKSPEHLDVTAERLRKTITWLGLGNLLLFPFVFLYQVLFTFFSLADIVRRDPGVIGSRKYSNYGRLRLRHYNELDHELNLRLNRSYEFAVKYMDQFVSPTMEVVAKAVAFTCGSLFAILFVLSAWDEDVLTIEHVITIMTVSGAVGLMCRSFIANENLVLCQNFLMRQIVANIHYAPSNWIIDGHSNKVCAEFGRVFQLKVHYFLEELLSPIVTPFILLFKIRGNATEIVSFYNRNTRSSYAMGDMCSFSMMDLNADGDLRFDVNQTRASLNPMVYNARSKKKKHAKVELSLMNFACQNPDWKPPMESKELLRNVHNLWCKDLQQAIKQQQMTTSAVFGSLAPNLNVLTSLVQSVHIRDKLIQTPPPSPTASDARLLKEQAFQQSDMMPSIANDFSESTAAALSASSIMRSLQQNSFIQAPTNNYYSGRILPHSLPDEIHALEMSMNALAVADLLMSRSGYLPNSREPNTYGATGISAPSTSNVPNCGSDLSQEETIKNLAIRLPSPPNISSNIWGVPGESTVMEISDETGEEMLHSGQDLSRDGPDLPPSAFHI